MSASTRFEGGTHLHSAFAAKSFEARLTWFLDGKSPGFECEDTRSYHTEEGSSASTCCRTRHITNIECDSEVPLMQAYLADSLSIQEMPTRSWRRVAYLYLTQMRANTSI